MLQQIGIVALGGALGATLRYAVSEWVSVDSFPYATLSVNLVGSFLLGVLAVGLAQNLLSANMALLLGTGVLGAFTTMSTFQLKPFRCLNKVMGVQPSYTSLLQWHLARFLLCLDGNSANLFLSENMDLCRS